MNNDVLMAKKMAESALQLNPRHIETYDFLSNIFKNHLNNVCGAL